MLFTLKKEKPRASSRLVRGSSADNWHKNDIPEAGMAPSLTTKRGEGQTNQQPPGNQTILPNQGGVNKSYPQ